MRKSPRAGEFEGRSEIPLEGEAPAANPIFLDNDDGVGEFLGGDSLESSTKACNRFCFAVIATPEKNQSGTLALGQGKDPGVVQIRCHHYTFVFAGALQDRDIRGTM